MTECTRIFVGGLTKSITEEELCQRFGKFGVVKSSEIKHKVDSEGTHLLPLLQHLEWKL